MWYHICFPVDVPVDVPEIIPAKRVSFLPGLPVDHQVARFEAVFGPGTNHDFHGRYSYSRGPPTRKMLMEKLKLEKHWVKYEKIMETIFEKI